MASVDTAQSRSSEPSSTLLPAREAMVCPEASLPGQGRADQSPQPASDQQQQQQQQQQQLTFRDLEADCVTGGTTSSFASQPSTHKDEAALTLHTSSIISSNTGSSNTGSAPQDSQLSILDDVPVDVQSCCNVLQLAAVGGPEAVDRLLFLLGSSEHRQSLQLNQVTSQGFTPLHLAASKGDTDMVMCLMKQPGTDLTALNIQGQSPLACAVASRCRQTITRYLVHLVTLYTPQLDHMLSWAGSPSQTPMAVAIAATSPDPLRHLLSVISISAARAATSQTPQAAEARHQALQGLLERPVDNQGRPPLLAALLQCKLDHVGLLLEHGAALCIQEPHADGSKFQYGNDKGDGDAAGAVPHKAGMLNAPAGSTPLHLLLHCAAKVAAGGGGHHIMSDSPFALLAVDEPMFSDEQPPDMIETLVREMLQHPQIRDVTSMQDAAGDTWVHVAIRYNMDNLVSLLRGFPYVRNACKNVANSSGLTPAALALSLGHIQCYDYLQSTSRPVRRAQSLNLHNSASQQPFLTYDDLQAQATVHVTAGCLMPSYKVIPNKPPSSSVRLGAESPVMSPVMTKNTMMSSFRRAYTRLKAKLGGKDSHVAV